LTSVLALSNFMLQVLNPTEKEGTGTEGLCDMLTNNTINVVPSSQSLN